MEEIVAAIGKVPAEFLIEIFENLKKKEIYQCMLVCKYSKEPAAIAYYEEIKLFGDTLDRLRERLQLIDSIKEGVEGFIKYGKHTHTLTSGDGERGRIVYYYSSHDPLSTEQFEWLVSQLPNLEDLNILQTSRFQRYMTIIRNIENSKYFTRVTNITAPCLYATGNISNIEAHLLACSEFHDKLTHLTLTYTADIEKRYDNFFSGLKYFFCLAHSKFENKFDSNTTFLQLVALCPQLVSLDYYSSDNITVSQHTTENHLEQLVSKNNELSAQYINCSRFKRLSIVSCSFPTAYFTYLTYFAPQSLETVLISSTDNYVDFFDCTETIGMGALLKLTDRLSQLKNVRIQMHSDRSVEDDASLKEEPLTSTAATATRQGRHAISSSTAVIFVNQLFNLSII